MKELDNLVKINQLKIEVADAVSLRVCYALPK